jgi:hypothetical protein
METPLHHFFDDRTDAAALDALIRGRLLRWSTRKTTTRHRPNDKLLKFLKYL